MAQNHSSKSIRPFMQAECTAASESQEMTEKYLAV